MSSTVKTTAIIIALVIALIVSNGYWLIEVKNLELDVKQLELEKETDKREQAEEYAKKLEHQQELTKSSIQTVTEETNHYMSINEQLEGDNNALRQNIETLLLINECANSDIPDNVKRMHKK